MFNIKSATNQIEFIELYGLTFAKPQWLDCGWSAIDADGKMWLLSKKPVYDGTEWQDGGQGEYVSTVSYDGDPADSLVEL